ncbi:MAG: restriction endonuclease, partial [Formivibrio sp.]|nr:restriction endonuclease [Formivibrio sp.]
MPSPAAMPPPAPVTPPQPPTSDQDGASVPGNSAQPLGGLVILTGIVILILVLRMRDRKNRTERVLKAVYATINLHKRALVRKRFQTLRHDDYGNVIIEQWQKELHYFVEKVVDPVIRQVGAKEYGLYESMRPALVLTIASQIEEQVGSSESFTFGPNLTPTDYEQYCAQQLRAAGWAADTTKTSGDQGTDIIAQKGELRLVIQCKLYNHPVGNKAVQEIAAARAHEQADYAVVVSNYRYTYSYPSDVARRRPDSARSPSKDCRIVFVDFDEVDQVLDAEVGEGHFAIV